MKILNLYAGIGGNRALWPDDVDVTAIEMDESIAKIYKHRFPMDDVVCGDAHEFLLDHFEQFDFIWSSPPCQTHSSFRQNIGVRFRGVKAAYPDVKLWQEIIFLTHNATGKWVVENVKPYYGVFLTPNAQLGRHLLWSNFSISSTGLQSLKIRNAQIPDLQEAHNVNLDDFVLPNKRQVLRNCVDARLGFHVLQQARTPDTATANLFE